MREIRAEILQKLEEIEKIEQVTVLHAVESGSRAWGVESPDSDYDVRFVYVRSQREYLRKRRPASSRPERPACQQGSPRPER